MKTITDVNQARDYVYQCRSSGKSVGLVPTMGALHQGHLSLARLCNNQCDHTIATIFVNPTQFAPGEDLAKYPRTLQNDSDLLHREGVDVLFVPDVDTMYPPGFSTFVQPPAIAHTLEGQCRPDHFRGVVTIVLKLFHAIPATHAFFGQKDYQQLKVIQAMVRDLNVDIEIVAGETVRESDSLAMSSRNRYLNRDERQRALLLHQALQQAQSMVDQGVTQAREIERNMQKTLRGYTDGKELFGQGVHKIDYAVVVDRETFDTIEVIHDNAIALIAAYVGQTRLIDNLQLNR